MNDLFLLWLLAAAFVVFNLFLVFCNLHPPTHNHDHDHDQP